MVATWVTAEYIQARAPEIRSLFRRLLRAVNDRPEGVGLAARETLKAEIRFAFDLARNEASISNLEELAEIGRYTLSQLEKGHLPKSADE